MDKSLVCITAYSNKFWRIKVQGNMFIVLYGKIGSRGSVNTKKFVSEEICLNEADKLIESKLNKGYWESDQEEARSKRFLKTDATYSHSIGSLKKSSNIGPCK
ncbi:WGR domain-containing protein [Planococcus donghaensis]|uniref:WGR domain-containing protein n=1 Tax=Planococcus donghaensis TaxID=414778 RepID=UPI0009F50EF5|nr:WGR domain-containing protein [Planococcus donghaensis]